ncbi:DNA-binding protein [Pandoraea pneumonica]|jgi:transcriptional regulator with XRE-family HTH domain|uniref:DNA-binding protein n=1 Tax=Pandoraea pneumonica TaxID=2508299 RepID=A0A5E4TTX0_9BURK|nr:DNA-binding protein [Pandoraea pneumonica]
MWREMARDDECGKSGGESARAEGVGIIPARCRGARARVRQRRIPTGGDLNRSATTSRAPRGARFNFRAIGERLRAYRLAAELRSEDVAERLDISRAAIYKLERGEIVKIDTLERLAALLGVSLANLLGVEVEYHDSAVSYFERMRQLEGRSERIVAHFDPISFLLTSSDYDVWLRHMLEESIPPRLADKHWATTIDRVLGILQERKASFSRHRLAVTSLIGLRQIEQFLHHGLVGRLGLPPGVQLERKMAARREVMRIIEFLEADTSGVQIGIVSDNMPNESFQIFEAEGEAYVAVSPFRLGELPNLRTGIATITTSPDGVGMYRAMIDRLWADSAKGKEGAALLSQLLARF